MSEQRPAILDACAAQLAASRSQPFGPEVDVFKVVGKVFALVSTRAGDGQLTVKCDPAVSEALRAEHPAITPGYHMNKRHWITVALDGSVPLAVLRELIEDSHLLVRPRNLEARP